MKMKMNSSVSERSFSFCALYFFFRVVLTRVHYFINQLEFALQQEVNPPCSSHEKARLFGTHTRFQHTHTAAVEKST
jgi:hypothetical protein